MIQWTASQRNGKDWRTGEGSVDDAAYACGSVMAQGRIHTPAILDSFGEPTQDDEPPSWDVVVEENGTIVDRAIVTRPWGRMSTAAITR